MATDTSISRNGSENNASRGNAPKTRDKAAGRSGTVNTRGFIQDREFNSLLRWPLNLDEYDKMRRTDPTVRWMLALLSTPIRAALWDVQPPPNPTDVEMEATCFARHAIFEEMDGGWDEHLRQALTYFDFGHSVFERVADLRSVEFDVDPIEIGGEPRHVKRDAVVLAQLGPRLQRTIQRWIVDPAEPSRLVEIIQWLADGHYPSVATIPADRLVLYVNEREGDDWRGVSILRAAWKSWFTKSELQNIEAIAFERTAGIPVVYPPAEAADDQIDAIEEAVAKLRQGENVFIIMPGPKQLPSRSGAAPAGNEWLIEDLAVDASAGMSGEFGSAISRYDTEMARNVMASFMQLGMQEVGARATADVQQDPYYQAIEAQVSYIEDTFTESVLRPLLDWNYTLERYPRLVASKVQAKNVQVVGETIAALVKVGAVQPDEPLQDWLRDLVDAPERDPDFEDEDDDAEEREPPEPEPRGGGGGGGDRGGGGTQQGAGGTSEPGSGPSPGMAASRRRPRLRLPGRRRRRQRASREAFAQFIPPRPLRGPENHVAWQQINDLLDNSGADIVAIAERVMGGQIDSLSSSANEAVERADIEAIEGLKLDPRPLSEAIEDELTRIYQTGQADVRAEVRRQEGQLREEGRLGEPMAEEREEGTPPAIPISKAEVAAIIAALATQLAEESSEAASRAIKQRSLKTLAQRAKTAAQAGGLEDPLAEMRAALKKTAPLAANRIYSMGRMDEIKAMASRGLIEVLVRSAVLDGNTCEQCEVADGETFKPEDAPPLPDGMCEGGDRCRCIYVPDLAPPSSTSLP